MNITATAKADSFFFNTRRKRRPRTRTEFQEVAAKAAHRCWRPAPHHKHPVLQEKESTAFMKSGFSGHSSTRFFPHRCWRPAPHHKHPVLQEKESTAFMKSGFSGHSFARSFKKLQPKLHTGAGAQRRTTSTQCFKRKKPHRCRRPAPHHTFPLPRVGGWVKNFSLSSRKPMSPRLQRSKQVLQPREFTKNFNCHG